MPFDSLHSRRLALVALILQNLGPVTGRTKLQKLTYLANLCGWNCFSDFKFHYYGPYSETLVKEVEGMKDNEWIYENGFETNNYRLVYQYAIRRERLADLLVSRINDPALAMKTVGLLRQLSEFDSDDLEIMASLVFLQRTERIKDHDELVEMTRNLKPRFSDEQITLNLRIFRILGSFLEAKQKAS